MIHQPHVPDPLDIYSDTDVLERNWQMAVVGPYGFLDNLPQSHHDIKNRIPKPTWVSLKKSTEQHLRIKDLRTEVSRFLGGGSRLKVWLLFFFYWFFCKTRPQKILVISEAEFNDGLNQDRFQVLREIDREWHLCSRMIVLVTQSLREASFLAIRRNAVQSGADFVVQGESFWRDLDDHAISHFRAMSEGRHNVLQFTVWGYLLAILAALSLGVSEGAGQLAPPLLWSWSRPSPKWETTIFPVGANHADGKSPQSWHRFCIQIRCENDGDVLPALTISCDLPWEHNGVPKWIPAKPEGFYEFFFDIRSKSPEKEELLPMVKGTILVEDKRGKKRSLQLIQNWDSGLCVEGAKP